MRPLHLIVVALFVSLSGVSAQIADSIPTFEVASIKVRTSTEVPGRPPSSPDAFIRPNIAVRELIAYAYDLQRFETFGLPEWATGSVRFEVAAKASFVPTAAQMRLMMQRLLAERFGLRAHTEQREMSVYMLRLARNDGRLGAQLKHTAVDCAEVMAERQRLQQATAFRPGEPPVCTSFTLARPGPAGTTIRYQASGMTIGALADWIAPFVNRTVIDRTGLTGDFDVDVSFAQNEPAATAATPGAPVALTTAIQEQLGLKLESGREPVEVLVVDTVNMPTPN